MVSDPIGEMLRTHATFLREQIGAQARSMLPMMALSPSSEAIAAGRAKREAIAVQRLAAATVEWESVRARAQNGPLAALLLALLDLHKPYVSFGSALCCEDCMSGSFATEAEAVDWPCETYGIIRDGLA